VNIPTVRFYERRGLLQEPAQDESGYRSYGQHTVRVVPFVRQAQELGFTLTEIDELLTLANDGAQHCQDVRCMASAKIDSVNRKIDALLAVRAALVEQVEACERQHPDFGCPLPQTLE
jgi:MerR family transcriptional regulator, mercuric resistance operon regulatory protein